jgi:hypothetical protein
MKRSEIAKCLDPYSLREYYRSCPENKNKKASDMEYFINKTMEARARKEKKSC